MESDRFVEQVNEQLAAGRWRRRWMTVALVALTLPAWFVAVTAFTGSPGPEPFRRFPNGDLDRLAERIETATFRPCGDVDRRPRTRVDRLRSRVMVYVVLSRIDISLSSEEISMIDRTLRFTTVRCGPSDLP